MTLGALLIVRGASGGVRFDAFEPTGAARMRRRW